MSRVTLLKTEKDYERFRKSRAYHSATITLRWISNPSQNSTRFGFIVPKKVVPKVTDRNKLKRRFKHLVGNHLERIIKADLLIFPKKPALKKTYLALELEFLNLIKQAGLWKR